jgi:peroxiredoxin
MYQDLHFYIDLDWTKQIDEPNYLKNIFPLVNLAYLHKANVYYSKHQLIDFTKNYNDLKKNYVESVGEQLDVILKNAKEIQEQNFVFEVCFSDEKTSFCHVPNMIISSLQNFQKQALFSSKLSSETFLVVKSNTEFEKVNISYFSDLQNVTKWIVDNTSKRNFHTSPKHGENGKDNWKGQSVLLCSKSEANLLLESAIPDFIEKENRLFNWDNTRHQTYIEFFFEGDNPQKQWHGFHLETKDWNRVPNSLRKFFNK